MSSVSARAGPRHLLAESEQVLIGTVELDVDAFQHGVEQSAAAGERRYSVYTRSRAAVESWR
jgi:hypothetical protein